MNAETKDHLNQMFWYIKEYHLLNGATEKESSFLAHLNTYRCKTAHNYVRKDVVQFLLREFDDLIEFFVDYEKITNQELLEVIFRKLKDIINSEEITDDVDNIPQLSVFVQNGHLQGRIDQINRRKF